MPLPMVPLTQQHCQTFRAGTPPLSKMEVLSKIHEFPGWLLGKEDKGIYRDYLMKDFDAAVELMSRIARIANAEDHHPDFHLTGYRKLRIELSTHSIGGLSLNDLIMAAKIEALPKALKE